MSIHIENHYNSNNLPELPDNRCNNTVENPATKALKNVAKSFCSSQIGRTVVFAATVCIIGSSLITAVEGVVGRPVHEPTEPPCDISCNRQYPQEIRDTYDLFQNTFLQKFFPMIPKPEWQDCINKC